MGKKEPIKINLSTAIIVATVVIVLIFGICICLQKLNIKNGNTIQDNTNNSQAKINELENEINELEIAQKSKSEDTKTNNEVGEYFILYNGCEMPKKTGYFDFGYIKGYNEENRKKYNITYYNYEKGEYLGESKGNFSEEPFDDLASVGNVKKIATSQKYNAIPRKFRKINQLPNELIDMADYSTVDIHSIDLDGDGTEEKLVCYTVNYKEGEIGDGEPQASSGMMLFDSKYNKIADLATLENGFWANIKKEEYKHFLSLDKVEYFDIDNDGIMEILIEVPIYETEGGANLSILKYNKGKLEGKTNIQASVLP